MDTTTNNNQEDPKELTYADLYRVLEESDKFQEEFVKALSALGLRCLIQEYIEEPIVMLPKRFKKTIDKLKKEST